MTLEMRKMIAHHYVSEPMKGTSSQQYPRFSYIFPHCTHTPHALSSSILFLAMETLVDWSVRNPFDACTYLRCKLRWQPASREQVIELSLQRKRIHSFFLEDSNFKLEAAFAKAGNDGVAKLFSTMPRTFWRKKLVWLAPFACWGIT